MYNYRIQKLQENLEKGEAMLITSGSNRFYFTGFRSSAGFILVAKERADFVIDFRYFERAKNHVKSCNVHLSQSNISAIFSELISASGIKRIYVETGSMSIDGMMRYAGYANEVDFSTDNRIERVIRSLRSVKTAAEIECIKRAQKITDDTFCYILERIEAGRTEREIMLDMEFYLRRQGSEGVSFNFIVLGGKNSSSPHGSPSDKVLEMGDFLTMDFGAVIEGYRSDMTRTVAIGSVGDEQRMVYNTVLDAQLAAINAIKAGKICKDIDEIARSLIYNAGYSGCFGHGLGHSIGIDVHESPSFNTSDESILKPGMVLTVEPGIYLEGKFGVRIEDMVVVTDSGCENLTHSPKELIIV